MAPPASLLSLNRILPAVRNRRKGLSLFVLGDSSVAPKKRRPVERFLPPGASSTKAEIFDKFAGVIRVQKECLNNNSQRTISSKLRN
jgi:hypothetical protein